MHNRIMELRNGAVDASLNGLVLPAAWKQEVSYFVDEAKSHMHKGQMIFTVIEWQYWQNNIISCSAALLDEVMAETHSLTREHLNCVHSAFLGPDKMIVAAIEEDRSAHVDRVKRLFGACLAYGANIKPLPVPMNFKAGSTCAAICTENELQQALFALYDAKESKYSNHRFYKGNMAALEEVQNHNQMFTAFLDALKNKRLRLAFQPIIEARTGETDSYEALLRVVTLEGDIISACPFIKAAESLGMVDVIDNIVLEAVAHELQVDSKVKIAMNISGNTANNDAWFSRATHLLPDYGTASRLIVEITESSREYHMDQMVRFTDQLRWLGCQISIDDFGAGYTSFSQLKMVSADYLKIDGVFIRNILTSPDSQLFIRVFIDFARAYGIKTVAEFVETGEIAKSLIDLGVDYLQGYYFSRALDYRPWVTSDLL
jgi:EAL domain-containing protein (putative c-di-GMP-specific phosphodiesterase class I)